MRNIPVDTGKLTTVVGGAIAPATTPDGSPRTDRQGRALYNVPVIVLVDDGAADTMTVRIPGPVPQVAALTPVRIVGLIARPWQMEGRSGVSFSAEALQPATAK